MIGLVLCTHHTLGQALLDAAEMIVGPFDQAAAVAIKPGDDVDVVLDTLRAALAEVDTGAGVMVLCDMFGGTPSNLSLSFLSDNVEVVTGVNLPMMLKFFTCRTRGNVAEVARLIRDHASQNIMVPSDLLRGKGKGS